MLKPRAEPALTGLLAKIRAATSASKAGPGGESPGARAIVDTRGEVARVGPKSIDRGDRHSLRKRQNRPRASRRRTCVDCNAHEPGRIPAIPAFRRFS